MFNRMVAVMAACMALWGGGLAAQTCVPGQKVSDRGSTNPDVFQIQILAVPNAAAAQKILRDDGFEGGWKKILAGMEKGSIPRTSLNGNGTVIVEGVSAKEFAKRLPYLMGDDVCQPGTLEVIPHGSGVIVVVPVMATSKGQSALLVPRALAAKASRICVEAPHPIYSEVKSGQLVVGKLNCANGAAAASAKRGSSAFLYMLVQAN